MTVALTSKFLSNARGLQLTDGGGVVWSINKNTNSITLSGAGNAPVLSSVSTADSISGAGTPASPVVLLNDSAAPGSLKFYGTNSSGVRGWYASIAVPVVANPSAAVGLTAVNGATGNWMDAGSAPALNVTISPVWTGKHTFAPSSAGTALTVNGTTGAQPVVVVVSAQGATNSQSDFQIQRAGSTANAVNEGPSLVLYDSTNGTISGLQQSGGQTELWQYNGGWTQVLKFLTTHGAQFAGPIGMNGVTPPAQSTGWGAPLNGSVLANFNGTAASSAQTTAVVAQLLTILKAVGILGT